MTQKPVSIYFVTWPDGQILANSPSVISAEFAVANALHTWNRPDLFPGLELGGFFHGPMQPLWEAMKRAGFKVHSVGANATGVSY